jgi:RNA polymerase sigma-70 factor (ECF subfamily)
VEEVVQEAFVRAFETRLRYPHLRCIRGWLLRITINLCNSRRRTAWWRRTLLTADYRGVEPAAADPAERGTVDGALWNAVQALPDTLQLPFLLRYTEELSGAEIAAILGCNESTVWSRIYTARRKLRERLGDAFAMPPDASL